MCGEGGGGVCDEDGDLEKVVIMFRQRCSQLIERRPNSTILMQPFKLRCDNQQSQAVLLRLGFWR